MRKRLPSLFVSHGAPTLAIESGPTPDFLRKLGGQLGKPRAIVVASAHWETAQPAVSSAEQPETLHDFRGFPEELHRMRYPAPGAPALAEAIALNLKAAGITASVNASRGLDHGAWVPLHHMFPRADVPVIPVSVQPRHSPAQHLEVGRALSNLRHENVLVMGSGSSTHNLREMSFDKGDPPEWAASFDGWLARSVTEGRIDSLLNYATEGPSALRNHPTPEHLLPLFVALGAGGESPGRVLYRDFTYGSISMSSFAWD